MQVVLAVSSILSTFHHLPNFHLENKVTLLMQIKEKKSNILTGYSITQDILKSDPLKGFNCLLFLND